MKEALKIYIPVEEKIKKVYGNLGAAYDIENSLSQKGNQYEMTYHNYNEDRSYL